MAVELLSPAGNTEIARSAILSGADAVYIGPPAFGARKAASNSMDDIARLLDFAHLFGVRVYLTMNTILYDEELEEARRLALRAEELGVDALIIQDMAYQKMGLRTIPLHASTQTFNFDIERIRLVAKCGFDRLVLERSLTLEEIRRIHNELPIELEAFVHGAMCVGMSGRCYLSQFMCGRSGNRGVCAQPCRNSYTLTSTDGRTIADASPLLSVSDISLADRIPAMIDAGVTSFKIEGRLKDESYVVNNTAYYSALLDGLGVARTSRGDCRRSFSPDPRKSFSRGTSGHMFLDNPRAKVGAPTRSLGEKIGTVGTVSGNRVTLTASAAALHNGDGVCWNSSVQTGAYVNGVSGNALTLSSSEGLMSGMALYRNYDRTFTPSSRDVSREVSVALEIAFMDSSLVLSAGGFNREFPVESSPARNQELAAANIRTSMSKTGDSPLLFDPVSLRTEMPFIRLSVLNSVRREFLAGLERHLLESYERPRRMSFPDPGLSFPSSLPYQWNISNRLAMDFYREHGVTCAEPALEQQEDICGKTVMLSRHCIRRQLGMCHRDNPKAGPASPMIMENNGRKLEVRFDCGKCLMSITALQ